MEKKCKAKLKSGKPCKIKALFGDYCNIHYRMLKNKENGRNRRKLNY